MMKILLNRLQCPQCNDVITSYHRHDFKTCTCGNISIDGGTEYFRYGWKDVKPINLSVMDDGSHLTRRTSIHWGKSYDKSNKRLPKIEYTPIKDLDTEHIWKILELFKDNLSKVYRDTFEDEIMHREYYEYYQPIVLKAIWDDHQPHKEFIDRGGIPDCLYCNQIPFKVKQKIKELTQNKKQ